MLLQGSRKEKTMSRALLVVMLLQGSAGAAPSVVATKPATVRPVPTTYRALVAGGTGESFRDVAKVAVVDTPALAADEVLVEVRYAGINGGCETFRARGEHAFAGNRDQAEFALGAEGVGVVAACARIKFSQRVLNRRVDLHAIDATRARWRGWRGDAGSSPLDGASGAPDTPVDFHTGAHQAALR